ncbi:MAG: glutamine-hydrolyzing carbamoyl-phosphate synthase small subunit [Candidatus Aminicenantales bacterium]
MSIDHKNESPPEGTRGGILPAGTAARTVKGKAPSGKAVLVLEDGTAVSGEGLGAAAEAFGEVVFNTAMCGYEEAFTDPSYAGQILLMTYPLVGNYGFHAACRESASTQVRGIVLNQPILKARRGKSLTAYLDEAGIPCLHGVDTRALTVKLREHGTMKAILTTVPDPDVAALMRKVRGAPHPDRENLVRNVSCPEVVVRGGRGKKVLLIDCGVKRSILENLKKHCRVIQAPYDIDAAAIERIGPAGIVVSNGPGDPTHPEIAGTTARTVKSLIGRYPVFGICLGHQILGTALGFEVYKLRFGHHGANHAVKDLRSGRIFITSQNHGYALREPARGADAEVAWMNVNDGTVEGIRHATLPVFSVQFHPEGGAGPHDTSSLFKEFIDTLS